MRALLTGVAGPICSHLVVALVEREDEVVVIDDLSSGVRHFVNPRAGLEVADIRTPEAAALLRVERPDVVFHLAAQMSVSVSVREPLFDADINVAGGQICPWRRRDGESVGVGCIYYVGMLPAIGHMYLSAGRLPEVDWVFGPYRYSGLATRASMTQLY